MKDGSEPSKEELSGRKPKKESDHEGSFNVARNGREREELTEAQVDPAALDYYRYGGPNQAANKRRMDGLKQSGLPKHLTSLQKHHLQRRKRPRQQLRRLEEKLVHNAEQAVLASEILQGDQPGLIETEHELERTTNLSQRKLKTLIDAETASNIFDLTLASGPYLGRYDRTGDYSLLIGKAGHVAMIENKSKAPVTEFHLDNEIVRDATFLHSYKLFSLAQRNHVYIYDHNGAEVHCLQDHIDPQLLSYLPYHWLLASVGRAGYLKYQDVSTGTLISEHQTKPASAVSIAQNKLNAVLHVGHSNGTVSLWSPASSKFLAKIQAHKGASINSIAVDGNTLVTGGMDRQIRIFDLRTFQEMHAYFCQGGVPTSMDLSQRGLLGIGHGCHATIWNAECTKMKLKSPYMHHQLGGYNNASGPVQSLRFRPYEDVCGLGHSSGFSSIVVPGSGEPYRDTFEEYGDKKQMRNWEVKSLLDKLSPEMITLDADRVGAIEEDEHRETRIQEVEASANGKTTKSKNRKKRRGQSKIQVQLRRKRKNVIDQSTLKLRELREEQEKKQDGNSPGDTKASLKAEAPAALKRFF